MNTLLNQLKKISTVVADTGDLEAIKRFSPQDATTNPSLILKAVQSNQYDAMLDKLLETYDGNGCLDEALDDACDRLIVAMGVCILDKIPGRVSTEVDARLSFDLPASLTKARRLVALYEEQGISRDRILIKLAATWEGISACKLLEKENIQCNLTLVFSFAQARAAAEAGAYLISPFVGRILDWHRKTNPEIHYRPEEEPGVLQVREIYDWYRRHQYATVVMGASFRNSGEVLALAGCDRLTISPSLLEELEQHEGIVRQALRNTGDLSERPAPIHEAEFRWLINQDPMATEKLAEGIRGFGKDQLQLQALLRDKLTKNAG